MSAVTALLYFLVVITSTVLIHHGVAAHDSLDEIRVDTSKVLFRNMDGETVVSFQFLRSNDFESETLVKKSLSSSPLGGGDRLRRGSGTNNVHVRTRRSTDFSSSDADAIVAKHNEGRGMVNPPAADMKTMEWDSTLATMAQQWSDGCYYEHGNPNNISPFSYVGQNLYISWNHGNANNPPDGTAATQLWYDEYEYYNFETNSCQAGQQCGHYTQNVWASTYAVGCGLTFCPAATDDSGNTYSNAWLITCNYGPGGNYRGQKPYTSGTPCTKCESGSGVCYANLCSDCSTSDAGCTCEADCQNCGTLNNDCTCTCTDGFYGSDCATQCEDTHQNCGANPGWPVSWCDRSYVIEGCPLMCSICNAADPNFVCNSNLLNQNGVDVLLYEDITNWNSIQASVLSSFRASIINYCNTRQSTCCPAANNTIIDFTSVGLTLNLDYPVETTEYTPQAAYWIRVVGISPVAAGVCATDDGGFLSPTVVRNAINQDLSSLESSLNVNFGNIQESAASRLLVSLQTILIALSVILLNV